MWIDDNLLYFRHHKKVIIHVPVVTRTVYKIIEKGGRHKHGGEVIHHHHHGGHVDHIHKHEGEAGHKHHHSATVSHHHKHNGLASHKHAHSGKGDHTHHHKGQLFNDHHHKGIHGHDHKHTGVFSNAHAHSGMGTHSHGHHGEGHNAHKHSNPFGHGQGSYGGHLMEQAGYFNDPTVLFGYPSQIPIDQHSGLLGSAPTSLFQKYDQNMIYQPYSGSWMPQYAPYSTYSPFDGYKMNPTSYQSSQLNSVPEYINEFSNVKSYGGVSSYALQNSKQTINSEYQEHPQKKFKKMKTTKFTAPQVANGFDSQISPSMPPLPSFDDNSNNLEEERYSTPEPEFDNLDQTNYEEGNTGESDEDDMGAYQSPIKTQVLPPKVRMNPKFVVPVVPYQVTETPSFY